MNQLKSGASGSVLWFVLGLVLFTTQACNADTGKIALPKGTQTVIVLGQEGKLVVLDSEGKAVPKCNLCSAELEKKYGPYCKEAPPNAGICKGLTGVTVQDVQPITIIDTHKNPRCRCSVIGGDAYCVPTGCNQ